MPSTAGLVFSGRHSVRNLRSGSPFTSGGDVGDQVSNPATFGGSARHDRTVSLLPYKPTPAAKRYAAAQSAQKTCRSGFRISEAATSEAEMNSSLSPYYQVALQRTLQFS